MTSENPFYDFSEYLKCKFPDFKVQKISVNAGFTCPNRDGSKGVGGCIYCNNASFTPGYCDQFSSITNQIGEGKYFFSRKYPEMKYLAYFQSYTNTYADIDIAIARYEEALSVADKVFMTPIVAAREENVYGVKSENVTDALPDAQVVADYNELADKMIAAANDGDLIITMGAGDIYKIYDFLDLQKS